MSEPNLKAMTQAELLKYLEEDFMPRLLPKLANVRNIEAENARLKADVERLRKVFEITERLMLRDGEYEAAKVGTYANLKAEVERLRKAGDELSNALAAFHLIHRGKIDTTTQPDIVAWNAAKEGKPSV